MSNNLWKQLNQKALEQVQEQARRKAARAEKRAAKRAAKAGVSGAVALGYVDPLKPTLSGIDKQALHDKRAALGDNVATNNPAVATISEPISVAASEINKPISVNDKRSDNSGNKNADNYGGTQPPSPAAQQKDGYRSPDSPVSRLEIAQAIEEFERRKRERKIITYYPSEGPLRRELYPKHLAFFAAGNRYRERLMLAGNRVGKTEGVGGYELVLHLTGRYPEWRQGRRFKKGVSVWVSGDTGKTTRDIIQLKLMGPPGSFGTGLIPKEDIVRTVAKAGVADALEIVTVRHVSGDESRVVFKSYDQRREAFQGTEQDVIWLDEEPPLEIYTECLLRTMTNDGMVMLTFTPLMGMSETVLSFMKEGEVGERDDGTKYVGMATWDDVPHLTQKQKDELWASIPPFQREARSKGVPQLGAGAIYPVAESEFVVDDMDIPEHWPKAYGLDVGWNKTACVWGALDRESDILYVYSEHYMGQSEPAVHAQGIRARGAWIPGVIDPASRGRGQADGQQLFQRYRQLGLDLTVANNAVEAGLYDVWQRLSSGRLKVFKSLRNLLGEYRLYRRDEKGHVVKSNDHLMDALRYLVVSGIKRGVAGNGTKAGNKVAFNVLPIVNYFGR